MFESLQLIIVLTAICLCALLAHRLKFAPAIAFLLGGVILALLPGFGTINIDPEYMLVLFLPPILMEAAFYTSFRDFKINLRPILLLAIALVILTAFAVAAVVHYVVPGASWALGFVLGAIVSPPDAAAATSALRSVRIPRRIMVILEGESLLNDATALVLYKFAVAAVITASFSFTDASMEFVWKAVGGTLIGVAVGFVYIRMFPYLKDQSVAILSTFIPPFGAYLLAESMHASGVLGVVAAGLVMGWHAPALFTSRFRIPAEAIWKMVVFLISAVAFLLVGLQLPGIIEGLRAYDTNMIIISTVAVCLISCIVRFAFVFMSAYAACYLPITIFPHDKEPPAWQNVFVVAWTGLRGVVTLATALALPLTLADRSPFPYRDLIIFLAVSVILFTLVVQGISLPWLLKKLTLSYDPRRIQEEWVARMQSTKAALRKLREIEEDPNAHRPALERIRQHYEERLSSLGDGPNTPLDPADAPSLKDHPLLQAENKIWQDVLKSERDAIISMRKHFAISDEIMHEALRDMDLLASRFHYEVEKEPSNEETPVQLVRRLFRKAA